MRCARGQVRLGDHNSVTYQGGLQRDWITAAALPHRLWIDRRSAILADEAVAPAIKADSTTDLAGIKNGGHVAVGLAIQKEADLRAVYRGTVTLQIAIRQLADGNDGAPVLKRDLGGGGQG